MVEKCNIHTQKYDTHKEAHFALAIIIVCVCPLNSQHFKSCKELVGKLNASNEAKSVNILDLYHMYF